MGDIACVCLVCGVRDDHSHPDGLCQNGHDAWIEEADFDLPEYDFWIERAIRRTGLSRDELKAKFMDNSIKLIPIIYHLK